MTIDHATPSMQDRVRGLSPAALKLLNEAASALGRGQFDVAEHALAGVLALVPGHAEALRLMGVSAQHRGQFGVAVAHLQQARHASPHDPLIHMGLGIALHETGAFDAASAAFQHACSLTPALPAAWYNLGRSLRMQAHVVQARDALQRAIQLDPNHLPARVMLADTLASQGDITGAADAYRDVLRRRPDYASAWLALSNLKTVPLTGVDIEQLQHALRQPGIHDDDRIALGFALAKAQEDQHDYPAAFDNLRAANALKRRRVRWDAAAEHAQIEAIMHAFGQPAPTPVDPSLGHDVIFIVSLPRSGSTLTEQILASHPQVEGANEIDTLPRIIEEESQRRGQPFPAWVSSASAADWARLGQDYLARTARWREYKPRFTDKHLSNWPLVGAALRMLPGAHVVMARRDPLETCFACYRQLFADGAHFSYDLADMAARWHDCARLGRFWQAHFPDRVLDHVHEALLASPEPVIRRLLDFCGLSFDPACMAFHRTERVVSGTLSAAQVRQPLRQATNYNERYNDLLNEIRHLLLPLD